MRLRRPLRVEHYLLHDGAAFRVFLDWQAHSSTGHLKTPWQAIVAGAHGATSYLLIFDPGQVGDLARKDFVPHFNVKLRIVSDDKTAAGDVQFELCGKWFVRFPQVSASHTGQTESQAIRTGRRIAQVPCQSRRD